MRIWIAVDVPDDAGSPEDIATDLAACHPLLADPTVYTRWDGLVEDEREREARCTSCGQDAESLHGDEAVCPSCYFTPEELAS